MMDKFYDRVTYNFDDSDDETGGGSQKRYEKELIQYFSELSFIKRFFFFQCAISPKKCLQKSKLAVHNWVEGVARKSTHWINKCGRCT